MRRWIIFGLIIMLAFVVAANLAGPSAWASDSHQGDTTVPSRTPKPPNTPVPPTKPPKEPTNTLVPVPTNTMSVATATRTATPQVTGTATRLAETIKPTLTPTATNAQATATATSEATPEAAVLVAPTFGAPTLDGGANVEPVVSAASVAEQVVDSTPADNSSNLWLLIVAAVLMLFGGVLLFGRRRTQDSAK